MKGLETYSTLKELLIDMFQKHPRSYLQKLRLFDDYTQIISKIVESTPKLVNPHISLKTRIYWIINNIQDFPRCSNPKCNRFLDDKNVKNLIAGYPSSCCPECAKQSPLRKQRYTENFMSKHGVSNPSQLDEVKQKKANTCIQHFGVSNPAMSKDVQAKMQATNIERYGTSCPINSNAIQQEILKNNIEKYGCEHFQSTDEFIAKIKATNNKRFGVDFPNQNPDFRKNSQKKYEFDGIQFDSAPEVALYIYCRDKDINVEYQPNVSFKYEYEGKDCFYQPDFKIDGELFEIKGLQFFEDRDPSKKMVNPYDHAFDGLYEAKHQCMIQNNVKILVDTNYSKYVDYVSSKYGESYLQSLKNSSKKLEEDAQALFERYGRQSFIQFQSMDFEFDEFDKDKFDYEMKHLKTKLQADSKPSYTIRTLHKSRYYCNKEGMKSPIDFWNSFKSEEHFANGDWKKFFINRYINCNLKAIDIFKRDGTLTQDIVVSGFEAMHLANSVSYLKPTLAKRLVKTYLDKYEMVFCPFNGFSGIMLGSVVGAGKRFIGQDLNSSFIEESRSIAKLVDPNEDMIKLHVKDIFQDSGAYECLLACPPYQKLEQWNFKDGNNIDRSLRCDQWIDECLSRYDCKTYLFVVDDKTSSKYANYVVEKLCNRSHFGKNFEYVVKIDRN